MKLQSYNKALAESVVWNLLWLTLGSVLMAICIQSVAAPHGFLSGGVMGVGLLVNYWTGTLTPLVWYALLCVPVYALGWFGDGAGAVVLGEVPEGYGILGVHLGSDGGGGPLLSLPAGGTRIPASEESVKNRLHYIHMEGNEVFKFAVKIMGEAAFRALEQAGMQATDVDWLIPHQANIRIIQSAAKRLKMPMEKVVVNVDRHGNTSSASIPIALEEAIHDGRIKSGQTVVMVGFGAGLTWASTVIRWHHK